MSEVNIALHVALCLRNFKSIVRSRCALCVYNDRLALLRKVYEHNVPTCQGTLTFTYDDFRYEHLDLRNRLLYCTDCLNSHQHYRRRLQFLALPTTDIKDMAPRPAILSASIKVSGPRTTHVQVTSRVTVTAEILSAQAPQTTSPGQERILGSLGSIAHSSLGASAPEATGVVYLLYGPPPPSTRSDQSGTPDHGAITGGILGGLAFLGLCLVFVALCRSKSRYQKRSAAKKSSSQATKQRSTLEAINEAHRRRKERNRRERERTVHASPYKLTRADMAEMVHQGNVMVAEQHAFDSGDDVEHSLSRPVAVAVPNIGLSRTLEFDRPDSATLPANVTFHEVDLSDYYLYDFRSSRGS